jgi:glutathione peroxidase
MRALLSASVLTATALLSAACSSPDDALAGAPKEPPAGPVAPPRALGPKIEHEVRLLDGTPLKLSELRGQALLIVNTASECGYTPQYEGLQTLHERYGARGLAVLAFPSNDFGGQEPGDAKTIRDYLDKTFHVSFPVFEKQRLKGPDKSPLWKTLTEELPEGLRGEIKWNFTKFLVNTEGYAVARFPSGVDPLADELVLAVEAHLPPAK